MTYSEYRGIARENLTGNWKLSIGVTLVATLLGGAVVTGGNMNLNIDAEILAELPRIVQSIISAWISVASILSVASFVIGGTVQLGYSQFLLNMHDRKEFSFDDLFSQFHRFKQGFLQGFLRNLYIALWSLLFIIPGIIKSYSYAMTPFIMADHPEMTAKEAINASKEMMDGHKGELFVLGLTFIGWNLLAGLTLGIGLLWVNPYMNAAYAAFYRDLVAQQRIGIE